MDMIIIEGSVNTGLDSVFTITNQFKAIVQRKSNSCVMRCGIFFSVLITNMNRKQNPMNSRIIGPHGNWMLLLVYQSFFSTTADETDMTDYK